MSKLILHAGPEEGSSGNLTYAGTREIFFEGPVLLREVLERAGVYVSHPCGGRGVCGRCRARVISPKIEEILTCQYMLTEDTEILLPGDKLKMKVEISLKEEDLKEINRTSPGIAIDIGTTTLAAAMIDLSSGSVMAVTGMVNPQTEIGADVISRIAASMNGEKDKLQKQILDAIRSMIDTLMEKAGVELGTPIKIVVTGNTTMLYLLTGEDPEPLSHAPFIADDLFGRETMLPGISLPAYLPPCMDAFVGADITCAVLFSGMIKERKTALLIDIGTNGEVALYKEGKLYVTSTAAGPAFESIGVFGSELIDALARFLDEEKMDETGYIDDAYDGELPINDQVKLTQKDVRTVQLAKAAIRAGLETVMSSLNVSYSEVDCLYIAGGFGAHLDLQNAVRIGLIPEELKQKTAVIGNASLSGALELLTDEEAVRRAESMAKESKHVELGGNPLFNELYVEKMLFE